MPIVLRPFCTSTFNAIPTLQQAARALQKKDQSIYGRLRNLLISFKLNDTFGISLIHAHFPLKDTQILVELNHETTPWPVDAGMIRDLDRIGQTDWEDGKVYPTSWRITSDNKLMPYEFAYTNDKNRDVVDLGTQEHQAFVLKFVAIVEDAGIKDCMGLILMPDDVDNVDGAIETTDYEENVNILHLKGDLHKVISPEHTVTDKHTVQASFFWPTNPDGTVREDPVGASCDSMDKCQCTCGIRHANREHAQNCPRSAVEHRHTRGHSIRTFFFWPTNPDGSISEPAKGASCDSTDTCKCTCGIRNTACQHVEDCPAGRNGGSCVPKEPHRDMPGTPTQEAADARRTAMSAGHAARAGLEGKHAMLEAAEMVLSDPKIAGNWSQKC